MRPTITAIVCAYNEACVLPACLYSLLAQTRPPDEILVVNNASVDEKGVEKRWEVIALTLRANVDVALTLYRNGSWAA